MGVKCWAGQAKLSIVIGIIMILGLSVSAVWGQEVRATIGGRVLDASGAVVPKAQVEVTSDATGVTQRATTNNDGYWVVQFLIPGEYHFTVTAAGFKRYERKGMTLQASDNKTVDVQLAVGAAVETVEVTAEVPLIDTTSATQGAVITSKEILEMPSMSRIPTLLATLAPGVQAQDQNNNPLHPWSYTGSSQIYGSGVGNVASNTYQLDGMPDTKSGNYVSYIPSPDSLQEFRVMTNAYDAQISRAGTMTINMQTKSGTSKYHGTLYEFNQNNFMNALPWGVAPSELPPVHLNQYGFTIGGPVRIPKLYNGKERTFFFFNWEGLRNANAEPTLTSVPTALERQGDFSQSYTVSSGRQYPINIYDPNTVNMTSGARQQFTNNVIPDARISPIAKAILKYVPLPNRTGDLTRGNAIDNYWAACIRTDKMSSYNMRVDHQWNEAHRSFVVLRRMYNEETNENDFLSVATGKHQPRSPRAFGADHVWTLSSNKVLDMRFSVNRYEDWQIENGAFEQFDAASLGLPTSFTSQLQAKQFPFIKGFGGDFGTGKNTYTFSANWSWLASLTHVVGKHSMRYGGEFWVLQQATQDYGYQPQFTFGSDWTRPNALTSGGTGMGSTFASYLLGLPNGGTVNNNASSFYSQHFTGFYFQDDWRATSKLTVNLGLRWDYERPVTERFDRMVSVYDPTAVSPINAAVQANYAANAANAANAGNAAFQTLIQNVPVSKFQVLGAQLFAGVNGQPRTAHNPDYHEFQPRVGFAYQITPTTIVRGGVGRFTRSSWENGSQTGFSQSTPFTATSNNYLTPADTMANPFVAASQNGKLLRPAGSSLGAKSNLGNSPKWVNQDTRRPTTWNMSLGIQQQYKNWLFDIGYVHTYTIHNWVDRDMNMQPYDLWYQLQQPSFDSTGRPVAILPWNQKVPNPFYKVEGVTGSMNTSSTVALSSLLRPIPIASVTQNDNPIGHSQYDAAQVKVVHRFSKGFSILNSFTWSKSFTDTSYWGDQIAGSILQHALSGQDRTFVLSIAPVWDVPIGRNRALGKNMPKVLDFFAGGWGLSGNYLIESGNPVSFSSNQDKGFYNGKDFKLSGSKQSLDQWFDTSAFMKFPSQNTCLQGNPYCDPSQIVNYPAWTGIQNMPGFNYYGVAPGKAGSDYKQVNGIWVCNGVCNGVYQDFATVERLYRTTYNNIRTPRTNEVNIALTKNFHATEHVTVQYRFEAFNAFNHDRFGGPNADPSSSSFGTIPKLQVNTPRAIQMGLKVKF